MEKIVQEVVKSRKDEQRKESNKFKFIIDKHEPKSEMMKKEEHTRLIFSEKGDLRLALKESRGIVLFEKGGKVRLYVFNN